MELYCQHHANPSMSIGRRQIDRRRRVLYSAAADTGPSTAASRREAARLREARRPAATYGSRVQRRLRGRWFGLVPVRRRTMSMVAGSIAAIALMLCAAHYASVAWPSLVDHGDIARPLRLDRPDSFGRWFIGTLMIASAGAAFLIYQLRRHRLDDFRGHYRVWRLVLVVMLLASLNSVVSLVDWSGAILDALVGRRVALAGADWIRIVVSLGGVILLLRLIAEVRHCRSALLAILAAAICLAIPEAVKWNVMQVETLERWTVVTSAPLLAFTCLFLSFGIYLRMLYREVRQLDQSDRLKDRLQRMRLRVFQRADREDDQEQEDDQESAPETPKRRWWNRANRDESEQEELEEQVEDEWEDEEEELVDSVGSTDDEPDSESRPKRRWFGLRAAKPEPEEDEDVEEPDPEPAPKAKKKRRFGLRLDPSRKDSSSSDSEQKTEEPDQAKPKRKFGLAAFRRQRAEAAAEAESNEESKPEPAPPKTDR